MTKINNIGWYFFRQYYHQLNQDVEIKARNEALLRIRLADCAPAIEQLQRRLERCANFSFDATSSGRGLLTGVGIPHERNIKHEFKMGMSFKSNTGLPWISGSSLKGALLAALEEGEYTQTLLAAANVEQKLKKSMAELKHLLRKEKPQEGRPCLFLGASLIPPRQVPRAHYAQQPLFRADVITPHREATRKPLPLPFLRLRAGLHFRFYFWIEDRLLRPYFRGGRADLKQLFYTILKYEGLGAKKNYDFGRFVRPAWGHEFFE